MDRMVLVDLAYAELAERKSHTSREKGWLFGHGLRTARIVLALRQRLFPGMDAWDDCLFAAALFHDVGKGTPHHNEAGALICRELLRDLFTEEDLAFVCELVREHDHRFHPEFSDPIRLLQDADLIDHSGTIDVWINLYRYAVKDGSPERCAAHFMDHNTTHQHRRLAKLNFDLSKRIYRERFAYSQTFFERFERELIGDIVDGI